MSSELLVNLVNELNQRHIFQKYHIMFPKEKLSLSFFINMSSEDMVSILALKSDISKILRINEILIKNCPNCDLDTKETSNQKVKR